MTNWSYQAAVAVLRSHELLAFRKRTISNHGTNYNGDAPLSAHRDMSMAFRHDLLYGGRRPVDEEYVAMTRVHRTLSEAVQADIEATMEEFWKWDAYNTDKRMRTLMQKWIVATS